MPAFGLYKSAGLTFQELVMISFCLISIEFRINKIWYEWQLHSWLKYTESMRISIKLSMVLTFINTEHQ